MPSITTPTSVDYLIFTVLTVFAGWVAYKFWPATEARAAKEIADRAALIADFTAQTKKLHVFYLKLLADRDVVCKSERDEISQRFATERKERDVQLVTAFAGFMAQASADGTRSAETIKEGLNTVKEALNAVQLTDQAVLQAITHLQASMGK